MINYLIDSDWAIDFLKGRKEIIDTISSLYDQGLAISVISLSELYEGIFGSVEYKTHLENLENFLNGIITIDVHEGIAKIFGKERAKLRKSGNLIDNFDLMIASTCIYYDLNLLTNNLKHFARLKTLKIGIK